LFYYILQSIFCLHMLLFFLNGLYMHLLIYHSSARDTCLRMLNVGEVISPKVLLWKPKMCETELPVCFILGLHCIITNAPVHYISRRELNKAKALAQQEDVPRPSNQLYVLLPPCTVYLSFWLCAMDSNKCCILYWHLFFFTKTETSRQPKSF
jgi:hypothetical protein